MFRNISRSLLITLLIAAFALPALAQRGSANFTRYVALGDSLTAGFESGALVATRQQWSYPAIMARQFGTPDFQQPMISEPGIPAELALQSLVPLVIAPKSSGNGQPTNLLLPRPYNNLGIPGADVSELLTETGAQQGQNPFFQIVLRGLGPAVGQAAALQPTFVSVWIGNNDVLGAVTSGLAIDGVTLTPVAEFTASYETLLDTLIAAAPNAGMVTATVPPVTELPFANTLPPVLIDPQTQQPLPGPDGNPIFLVAEKGDGTVGQLAPGSKVLLTAQSLLATGFGIPAALAPVIPLPNVGKPLPNQAVVDLGELTAIETRRQEINAVIMSAAGARNIPVVVVDPVFNEYAEGVEIAGVEFSLDFLTGGVMSYDGVHPADIGYMIVANEFIKVINDAYGAQIPYASLLQFFSDNAPVDASIVMLPRWMKVNLVEAPWSLFPTPFEFDQWEEQAPNEPRSPTRSRTRRSGGNG